MNKQNKPLKVTIKTFGCQMNFYDTEVAVGVLKHQGFSIDHQHEGDDAETPRHESRQKTSWYNPDADVVLMNTCSVREHAEDKVFSCLGMLRVAKKTNPDLIVGLMGCMVEEHREKLFRRFPHLDLMVGTRNIKDLPNLIEQVKNRKTHFSSIKRDGISIEYTDQIERRSKHHAWLPIMTGCNKVCTFCIVPITRGSEVSMKARDVYREVSRLVSEGVSCVTLLGQNVNSYNGAEGDDGLRLEVLGLKLTENETLNLKPETLNQNVKFPDLLDLLCEIEGLKRLSFTTSHPHDATEELFRVIQKNPKISRRFHLPLQSGSDRILKRMKRLHTFADYKAKIDLMREIIPDMAITTDIIAGFPGETEEDHQATIKALQEIRYDSAYIYKYSLRPGTPAENLKDDVPKKIKERRNAELLTVQKEITKSISENWVGKTAEVFFEEDRSFRRGQIAGRTSQDKRVVVDASENLLGTFQSVRLDVLKNETFFGTVVVDKE